MSYYYSAIEEAVLAAARLPRDHQRLSLERETRPGAEQALVNYPEKGQRQLWRIGGRGETGWKLLLTGPKWLRQCYLGTPGRGRRCRRSRRSC